MGLKRSLRPNGRFAVGLTLIGVVLVGLVIRWLLRGHATDDATNYLLPWYTYARSHGAAALGDPFTNYTPFIPYLIVAVAKLHGLAAPLTLMKAISTPFEFACAALVYRIVRDAGGSPWRAAGGFTVSWLAPTVLMNGALWGQAEAIWTSFLLLAIWLFMRQRNGLPAFGLAFAVKFPAAFLGPFVLGLVLQRRVHWLWLLSVPTLYALLAAPVVLAGRSAVDVATIYLHQSETFDRLTMNAANIWVFLPIPYPIGVVVGLVLATFAGLVLAVFIARLEDLTPERLVKVAAASLLLMPLLMPKMHERYFYAFELAIITLAFINPRYLAFAAASQVSGVLAYLVWGNGQTLVTLPPAALVNLLIAVRLFGDLRTEAEGWAFAWGRWAAFAASSAALILTVTLAPQMALLPFVFACLTCVTALDLLRATTSPFRSSRAAAPGGATLKA